MLYKNILVQVDNFLKNGFVFALCLLLVSCSTSERTNNEKMLKSHSANQLTAMSDPVVRENIDGLHPDKLAAYLHALRLLMDKSENNIYDINGFLWQTWVHNCPNLILPINGELPLEEQVWPSRLNCRLTGEGGLERWTKIYESQKQIASTMTQDEELLARRGFPGQCQHHSDVFLQWHRAQFYYFEQLLRLTDPNGTIKDSAGIAVSTKNVAVPYWDFTKVPSGNRYPKDFENIDSILFVQGRNTEALTSENMPWYTKPELIAFYVESQWQQFGGLSIGNPVLPQGVIGEGKFESNVHDNMHSSYVGGLMGDPKTAALDPIFYSFHSYIDFIYEKWLKEHGHSSITSTQTVLRSQQPPQVPNPPNWPGYSPDIDLNARQDMGRGEIYFKTNDLGYVYPDESEDIIKKQQAVKERLSGKIFSVSEQSPLTILLNGLPKNQGEKIVSVVQNNALLPKQTDTNQSFVASVPRQLNKQDYSFRQEVYLHPASISESLKQALLKGEDSVVAMKYLASINAYWQLGEHVHHGAGHSQSMALNADVTNAVKDIISQKKVKESWVLTAVIYSNDSGADKSHFNLPNLLAY